MKQDGERAFGDHRMSSANHFGISICGAKKKVNKLTGSMALLR